MTGAFPPGFRLDETYLSEQMNLSRGTIRSALNDLAHEGLVTHTAHTPHVSGPIVPEDVVGCLLDNLARYTRGEPLHRQVDRSRGY